MTIHTLERKKHKRTNIYIYIQLHKDTAFGVLASDGLKMKVE